MKEIIVCIILLYLVWLYIIYNPKLDWLDKEDKTRLILWYTHSRDGRKERKYIILL